jgi:mRNA interferase MazF
MLPEAGDLYWIDFSGGLGTEQQGRRPGLILTGQTYHAISRRAFVVPVTSRIRDWPTEVLLPDTMTSKGVLLVDQARFIERESRIFEFIEVAPPSVVRDVRSILSLLLALPQVHGG